MSLIIALILIIIVMTLMSNNKSKVKAYERKRNAERAVIEEWEALYVDEGLERKLLACISEKENYDVVYREVSEVIANMEHWKYLLDSGFPLNEDQIDGAENYKQAREEMLKNREIARDIMLANRGKVSSWSNSYGYKAYVRSGSTGLKEMYYEYAETILNILQNRGVQVELLYMNDTGDESYRWAGSFGDRFRNDGHCVIMKFDRGLFVATSIPPIK